MANPNRKKKGINNMLLMVIIALVLLAGAYILIRWLTQEECPTGVEIIMNGNNRVGEKIDFEANVDAESYSWSFGDGSQDTMSRYVSHVFNQSGKFTIRLTLNGNESCTVEKLIEILPSEIMEEVVRIEAQMEDAPKQAKQNDKVTFRDRTNGATKWYWTFTDDDSRDTLKEVTHTFKKSGTWEVSLLVNGEGHMVHKIEIIPAKKKEIDKSFNGVVFLKYLDRIDKEDINIEKPKYVYEELIEKHLDSNDDIKVLRSGEGEDAMGIKNYLRARMSNQVVKTKYKKVIFEYDSYNRISTIKLIE